MTHTIAYPPRTNDPMRLRARITQLVVIAVLLLVSTGAAHSGGLGGLGGLGGGMPWEGPLQQIEASLTGPVSHVIGACSIICLGFGVAFSEGGSVMRKALWAVLGLAIAFNAVSWGLGFLGFSGGLLV
ncbi:MAG: TrbC/VirB2 family protein [Myxococcota bacterium]|nr:TrbC/VirB2 family protein [Myxococcota bacterium]